MGQREGGRAAYAPGCRDAHGVRDRGAPVVPGDVDLLAGRDLVACCLFAGSELIRGSETANRRREIATGNGRGTASLENLEIHRRYPRWGQLTGPLGTD